MNWLPQGKDSSSTREPRRARRCFQLPISSGAPGAEGSSRATLCQAPPGPRLQGQSPGKGTAAGTHPLAIGDIRFRGMPNTWLGTIPRLPRLLFLVVVVVLNVVWQMESPEHCSAAVCSCPCPCRDREGACRKARGATLVAGGPGV